MPTEIAAVVGVITKNKNKKGKPYFNSAALLQKGKKAKFFNKQLLPTGDVFDEGRFIENGDLTKNFFRYRGKTVFVSICEDIWAWPDQQGRSSYKENPLEKIINKKIDVILNLSASPYYPSKVDRRKELVIRTAKKLKAPMIYCNLIGGQDEIIFDGASFAVSEKGSLLMQSLSFEEDFNIVDLDKDQGGVRPHAGSEIEQIRKALVLGLRDFCKKVGIRKAHLGLSGGVDSALALCLAVDALGANQVSAYALPGPFSSNESLSLAKSLANHLGVSLKEISINQGYETILKNLDEGLCLSQFGLVHENLQARLRGIILMAVANHQNSLLLTTSNKSEYASGYSTLYGDMCGGLAPIGDLTKGQIYQMCELYNQEIEIIPRRILTRPPTAELRENQTDQDSLPPYSQLDKSVENLVENSQEIDSKTDKWLFAKLIGTEFKRWQAPPILKVSKHSFGRGRRWPIAQAIKED